jgi:hypothetical protein
MVKLNVLSRFFGKRKEYKEGGIVPQNTSKNPFIQFKKKKGIEFKVEKVYDFKKGGRYFFVLTTDKPITDRMYEALKEATQANNKRLMKDLGIISSIIVLDNGFDIKVIPSGEKQSDDWTDPAIRIQKIQT